MITYHTTPELYIVPWSEVRKHLGRDHEYTQEDDDSLFNALQLAGADATECLGTFADDGWCIYRPKRLPTKPPPLPQRATGVYR